MWEKEISGRKAVSLVSRMPPIQGRYSVEGAETLALPQSEVGQQFLRYFLGSEPKRKDENYVEQATMSIARLYARL